MGEILGKICPVCKEFKVFGDYAKRLNKYQSRCKVCDNKRRALYRECNLEKELHRVQVYRKSVIGKKKGKDWRANNKNKERAMQHRYEVKNKDELNFKRNMRHKGTDYYHNKNMQLNRVYSRMLESAKKRSIPVDISRDDFYRWYDNQNKVCFYCGVPESSLDRTNYISKHMSYRLTVDRKNNEVGYQEDNIVMCCSCCNTIKNRYLSSTDMQEIGLKYIRPKWSGVPYGIIEDGGGL